MCVRYACINIYVCCTVQELYERLKSAVLLPLIESAGEELSVQLEALMQRELVDPMNAVTNSTAQHSLLEVVNAIRQRTFEHALREILDTSGGGGGTADGSGASQSLTASNLDDFREEVRFRLGCWYMARHGVGSGADADNGAQDSGGDASNKSVISGGSVHEMITLIQASVLLV
jgi:hypothetical protein